MYVRFDDVRSDTPRCDTGTGAVARHRHHHTVDTTPTPLNAIFLTVMSTRSMLICADKHDIQTLSNHQIWIYTIDLTVMSNKSAYVNPFIPGLYHNSAFYDVYKPLLFAHPVGCGTMVPMDANTNERHGHGHERGADGQCERWYAVGWVRRDMDGHENGVDNVLAHNGGGCGGGGGGICFVGTVRRCVDGRGANVRGDGGIMDTVYLTNERTWTPRTADTAGVVSIPPNGGRDAARWWLMVDAYAHRHGVTVVETYVSAGGYRRAVLSDGARVWLRDGRVGRDAVRRWCGGWRRGGGRGMNVSASRCARCGECAAPVWRGGGGDTGTTSGGVG